MYGKGAMETLTDRHASWSALQWIAGGCAHVHVGELARVSQSKLCMGAIDARFHGGNLPSTCSKSLKFSYRANPRELDSATCHGARARCSSRRANCAPGPHAQATSTTTTARCRGGGRRHLVGIVSTFFLVRRRYLEDVDRHSLEERAQSLVIHNGGPGGSTGGGMGHLGAGHRSAAASLSSASTRRGLSSSRALEGATPSQRAGLWSGEGAPHRLPRAKHKDSGPCWDA